MCAGANINVRVSRVVYGARDNRLGAQGSTYDILAKNPINRVVEVEGPVLEEEARSPQNYFADGFRYR
jgi:tRNA(adenine34) deaminase